MQRMVDGKVAAVVLMVSILCGCATVEGPIKMESLPGSKPKTLAAIYSTSYFQERLVNIGKVTANAAIPVILGPLLGPALSVNPTDLNQDAERMRKARMESSAYERLLGDFEVLRYFAWEFAANTNQLRYLSVQLTDTDKQMRGVIERAKSKALPQSASTAHEDDPFSAYLALKFSYGIGPRQGNEQFGFVKKSRTYVRVLGILKKKGTNDILWRNDLIVFGDKPYTSSSGKAENIDGQELVESFKSISTKLVNLLIQDLNAVTLPPKPVLLITTNDDNQF